MVFIKKDTEALGHPRKEGAPRLLYLKFNNSCV